MFIGHLAVGLAAKRVAPRTSLGWLIAGTLLIDLIWPVFVLLGWETVEVDPGNTAFTPLAFTSYPITHSLITAAGWALVAALLYSVLSRQQEFRARIAGAIVVGVAVISHWFLDALVHRPDLPLVPGGGRLIGLGLWNSVPATLVVEICLLAAGVWIYARLTRPEDRKGSVGFWSFVALMSLIYFGNLATVPPSSTAVAVTGLSLWILPFWAAWFDRHRVARSDVV